MDLDNFTLDDNLSVSGKWVPISANASLLIARLNNEKYREFVKKKLKPYRSAMRAGSVDEDLMNKVVIQAVARHVLLDWKGLTEKGNPVPYSIEKAEEVLEAKEAFRDLVISLASDQQLFMEAEEEDSEKNS